MTAVLAAGALHDFNNAVQAIGASLRLVERKVARSETESLQAILEAMGNQITRIASLGAAMARADMPGAPAVTTVIAVEPFIRAMMPQIAALFADDTHIDLSVGEHPGNVTCDPARLESAVRNLVLNSHHAMPVGGVLTLRVSSLKLGLGSGIDGIDPRSALFAAITVADTGLGMAPETLRRCFEPFVTTKQMNGGTGLGLFQLRAFAEEAGGTVQLQSREGHGTEATILLPCSGVS